MIKMGKQKKTTKRLKYMEIDMLRKGKPRRYGSKYEIPAHRKT